MRKQMLSLIGARGLTLFLLAVLSYGCAAVPVQKDAEPPAKHPVSEIVRDDVTYPIDAYDPWEGMNRRIYKFNAIFDNYVFLPVVSAYEFITPNPVEDMVSNFFNNLHEVTTLINTLLQFKGGKSGLTLSRILVNTTVGIGGLFDVATKVEVPKQNEDFGQTLGFYGLGPGPYIVLPVLGPSTLRDTGGYAVDAVTYSLLIGALINELDMDSPEEDILRWGLTALDAIDTRHQQKFRYYATGSPFEYDLIRMLFLEKRILDIEN
jgi:phospholipid-binding lipoprotein MlaA